MEQDTINQRLKFLVDKIGLSSRAFSELIGESPTNTHNYIGARQAEPRASYLTKVLSHFSNINPTWLMLGEGEPFKDGAAPTQNQTNISGSKNIVASGKGGKAILNNYSLADCEKERDTLRIQFDNAQREIELLTGQLQMQKTIIESKDQMLDMLRGGFNRQN
jgi:hypothetical protein